MHRRYLYWEFCHYGAVDGQLPQVYQDGWVQAVRWDDNATAYETEWKAILSNRNTSALLLYNLTDDVSESVPLLAGGVVPNPHVARARDIILSFMQAAHVEDPYWVSALGRHIMEGVWSGA